MASRPFHFKQFTIEQDQCAMKVGTDGALLGGWCRVEGCRRALDIGTGTGLIALMLAQRNSQIHITALEPDGGAATQAGHNFEKSPWTERLQLIHSDLQSYHPTIHKKFDLIVCNPPFFNAGGSILPTDHLRAMARTTIHLTQPALLEGVSNLITDAGLFSLVLPADQRKDFVALAKRHALHLNHITHVFPTPRKASNRTLMTFSKNKMPRVENSLIIQTGGRNEFSEAYKKLMVDFYTII